MGINKMKRLAILLIMALFTVGAQAQLEQAVKKSFPEIRWQSVIPLRIVIRILSAW